ncbi:RhaT protein [[Mannheimia] succiniciproducens MBEL55E]|uniref:RhaT protein n=2 Tax=Basfia TaxID=697331 RepID=Q65U68_MANSM|nr:RhaT protein [[Mannheimia] succiniciproducens MBEL55E]
MLRPSCREKIIMVNNYNLALIKVHFTAVLFGLTGVLGVIISADSDVIVLGRVIIAFLALSVYFLIKREKLTALSTKDVANQSLSGALLTAHWVTFYVAVKVGGVAVATLGFAGFPGFVALFERLFFQEKLKRRELILLIAVTIGLILVTPQFEFGNQSTQGLLWGIFSGAIYGILAILNRKNINKLSGTQASWWQYLIGSILLFPFAAHKLPAVSVTDWFWIACLGLLCTSLAYTLFVSSLNIINARTAAMIISLEPVYAILIAWIWLGEQPGLRMIIGGLIILLSVGVVNFRR